MRRFFSTSFIALALVVGVAPAAHAQTANGGSCFVNADCASNYCSQTELLCKASATTSSGNTYAPGDAPGANQPTDSNLGKDTASQFGTIMTWLMSLFAWLVGVAALVLNYAVFYTVVTMGDYVNNLSAVGVAWTILRDLGNIIIIFGFLAIGITTILNVNWYGGGFKMLPKLLVAAVFLNFSLFITEAVIDTGNLFATQFYTQINGGKSSTREALSGVTVGTFGFGGGSLGNEAISNAIMGKLGFQTIYGQARNQNKELFNGATPFFIGFMGIILFLIAAFVMFSLAFILIARFVILLFLIIISPIGFAGLAIPQLAASAKKWWDTLFEQAITAPVLLLLLYIALTVITDERFLTGSGQDWTGFATGNFNGFASMMLSFLVAMGLLLAVTIFSKKLSAFGGGMAMKWGSRLSGASLIAAGLGKGTGYLGRRFVGRIGTTKTGKFLGMGGLATASFDFRNSKLAKTAQTRVGLDLGTGGGKGGYKTYAAEKEKSENKKKTAAELKQVEKATTVATQAHSQIQTEHNVATAEHTKQMAEIERLEKAEKARVRFNEQNSPQEQRELDAARATAAISKANLEKASAKLVETKAARDAIIAAGDRIRDKISKREERAEIDELREKVKSLADKNEKEPRGEVKEEPREENKK